MSDRPASGTTRYFCPVHCGWHYDVPPPEPSSLAGPYPATKAQTVEDAISSLVEQAMLRHADATETALKKHVAEHGIHTAEDLRVIPWVIQPREAPAPGDVSE